MADDQTPTDEPVSREGEGGTFQTTRHLVPVTDDTVRCETPWDWLDWSDVHLDPGFPDDSGRYREGYFKVRTSHAPAEYDPHNVVVRARCAVGPSDYWEQEPDPEEGYEPPPSSFRGEPIHEVTPAKDAHGMPWWIIVTRQDTGATHADARSKPTPEKIREWAGWFDNPNEAPGFSIAPPRPSTPGMVLRQIADGLERRLSDAPSGKGEADE